MNKKVYFGLPFAKPKNARMATEAEAVDRYPYVLKAYGMHAITAAHYKVLQDNYEAKQAAKKAVGGMDKKRKDLLVKLAGLKGEKKYKTTSVEHYAKKYTPEELQKLRDDLVQIDEDIKKVQNELNNA